MTKKFLKDSVIFCAGNFNVILLNYLVVAIMARTLTQLEFGEVNTLLAIFRYVLTLGMAVYLAVSHKIAHQSDEEQIHWFRFLEKALLIIGLVIFVTFFALEKPLQSYFHIEHPLIFSLLGVIFIVAFLLPLSRGFLAGKKEFKSVTLNSNLEAILKIVIFGVFVWFGEAFYGALVALGVSIFLSYLSNRRLIFRGKEAAKKIKSTLKKPQIKAFLKHVFHIAIGTGIVTAFYSFDIILMQHFNPAENPGYVILNKMAQVIFLVTNSLIVVMFPEVKKNGGKGMGKKIYTTLGLTVGLSFGALLGFMLLGPLALNILFGSTYVDLANLLPYSVGIGLFLSLINLATHYFLGKKQGHSYMWILGLGLLLMAGSMVYFSGSLTSVLTAVCISFGLTALGMVAKMLWEIQAENASENQLILNLNPPELSAEKAPEY